MFVFAVIKFHNVRKTEMMSTDVSEHSQTAVAPQNDHVVGGESEELKQNRKRIAQREQQRLDEEELKRVKELRDKARLD